MKQPSYQTTASIIFQVERIIKLNNKPLLNSPIVRIDPDICMIGFNSSIASGVGHIIFYFILFPFIDVTTVAYDFNTVFFTAILKGSLLNGYRFL
jgi:hypothetical protein